MRTHALAVFHRAPDNLNCAQAVLAGYQAVRGRHVAQVDDYRPFGGGRAPGGECGALFAACRCAPEAADKLRADFATCAGSALCKTLRGERRFSCVECVGVAAELLQRQSAPGAEDSPR